MNQQELNLDLKNLSIHQTKEFNECVIKHRKDFDQMLCKLAKQKNLHTDIFFTSIFSREPEFSPLYERCCKLSFIKKQLDSGLVKKIIVDEIELTDDLKQIDSVRREVGMVFQHFNLFPHLTVLENCTLAPIWVRKTPKAEAEEIAMEYLTRVNRCDLVVIQQRIKVDIHKAPSSD